MERLADVGILKNSPKGYENDNDNENDNEESNTILAFVSPRCPDGRNERTASREQKRDSTHAG